MKTPQHGACEEFGGDVLEGKAPERQLSRAARLCVALRRDGEFCVWCARPLPVGSSEASVDHLIPKLKGGPSWTENEVAACRSCNHARGHLPPMEWLRKCVERGLEPAVEVVAARLYSLVGAIQARGGQRRARPYLSGQIRRLEKWLGDFLPREQSAREAGKK